MVGGKVRENTEIQKMASLSESVDESFCRSSFHPLTKLYLMDEGPGLNSF